MAIREATTSHSGSPNPSPATDEASPLPRVLGPLALTSLSIGGIIGTGIFIMTGMAAHEKAGPALIVSFVVAAIACIACALCYAEFASAVPRAGSAYTYARVTLGKGFGWIVGWNLLLQYGLAAASVAQGWSHYFQDFLSGFGVRLPGILGGPPIDLSQTSGKLAATGSLLDLPAFVIVLLITLLVVRGLRMSMKVNGAIVVLKLCVILFVIVVGAFYVHVRNWTPFAPFGWGGLSLFGKPILGRVGSGGEPVGALAGAALVFYAFMGFDAVTAYTLEARRPRRDVPIAIIASIGIATVLYIAVTAVLTGMVPYDQIQINAPLSSAFRQVGLPWAQRLISLGATAGITSVLLIILLTYPRILVAMGQDGMLSRSFFAAIHPRFQTPWKGSLLVGIVVSLLASLVPLHLLMDLVILGTLFGFVLVASALLALRRMPLGREAVFRAPGGLLMPVVSIGSSLILMCALPLRSWLHLLVWLGAGCLLYAVYGRNRATSAPT